MPWKGEPVEGAFNGATEVTVRTFPGGLVTDCKLVGFSFRNTDTIEHTFLLRHKKAGVYSDIWTETVMEGQSLKGPVPLVGMDAADESIVATFGEVIGSTNPRWTADFVDRTAA